jgi:hypothetical protein
MCLRIWVYECLWLYVHANAESSITADGGSIFDIYTRTTLL